MKFIPPPQPRPFRRGVGALLLALLLAGGTAHGAAGGGGGKGIVDGQTNYFSIEPAFVVNVLDGRRLRFLQVGLDIVSQDSATIEAIQTHSAPIRHELLMLFTHQDVTDIQGRAPREALRQAALERIQATLLKYANIEPKSSATDKAGNSYPRGVQDVLFTSFVIQ